MAGPEKNNMSLTLNLKKWLVYSFLGEYVLREVRATAPLPVYVRILHGTCLSFSNKI